LPGSILHQIIILHKQNEWRSLEILSWERYRGTAGKNVVYPSPPTPPSVLMIES